MNFVHRAYQPHTNRVVLNTAISKQSVFSKMIELIVIDVNSEIYQGVVE